MLDVFEGMDPNGSWTLFLADFSVGVGYGLETWSLEIAAVPELEWTVAAAGLGPGSSGAHPDTAPIESGIGVAMSSSFWERASEGKEDVAVPFEAGCSSSRKKSPYWST
jgi:hypothetical protein